MIGISFTSGRVSRFCRICLAVLLPASVAGLTLAACGGSGSGGSGSATSASASRPPSNLTIAYPSKIQTLDPDTSVDYGGNDVLHLIGGNLVEERGIGDTLSPGLAAKYTHSADYRTYTFTLRPNLKFSNGMPLTSADVKASFDRFINDPANTDGFYYQRIARVVTPNPASVVFDMKVSYPSFPYVVAEHCSPIFPASLINKKGFFTNPISAGPYKLQSWGGTDTAVLVVNPHYWGPKPVVPKITMSTIADPSSALAQVQSGQIDIAFGLPPSLRGQAHAPAVADLVSQFGSEVMTLRNTAAPFTDPRVRVAVSDAIDRQQMSNVIWDGVVKPLKGFWPSTMIGYQSLDSAPNIQAAKAMLKGTACANGCSVPLYYSAAAYPEQAQEALIISNGLKQIGIKTQLVNLDPGTYYVKLTKYNFTGMYLWPLYGHSNMPDGFATYAVLENAGQEAGYTGANIKPWENAATTASASAGSTRTQALHEVNSVFVSQAPFVSLTDYALLDISRVPTSVAQITRGAYFDIARQG